MNVEAITFNNGYYTVDITYYYRITGETSPGGNTVTGLAIFTKRVMLCGGVGTVTTSVLIGHVVEAAKRAQK